MKDHMRAIVIENLGGPEVLRLDDLKRLAPPEEWSECLLLAVSRRLGDEIHSGPPNGDLRP